MDTILHTKYGTAKINDRGYYQIVSTKESNNGKLLHRLIAADYFGDWIDEPLIDGEKIHIHHIDSDKTNNCVLNLLPLPNNEHSKLHNKCENNHFYGKNHSEESKQKMSETKNTSGYFRVYKDKAKDYKQGFRWKYQYQDKNGKRKTIVSADIEKLEEKVKQKGLLWKKIRGEIL